MTALAAFLASFVEFVEALTVILALGATRGWRAPLAGAACAALGLSAIAGVAGPGLWRLELGWVRLGVGVLALLFGLRWLHRAILRGAGIVPLRDEARAYARASARYGGGRPAGWDWVAFAGGFQVTFLEGSEVAFIVVALGAGAGSVAAPAIGALVALAVVVGLGVVLHRPLSRIPENTLKGVVGVMLTGFGTFWTGEGLGAAWPGGDAGLILVCAAWGGVTLGLIRLARREQGRGARA